MYELFKKIESLSFYKVACALIASMILFHSFYFFYAFDLSQPFAIYSQGDGQKLAPISLFETALMSPVATCLVVCALLLGFVYLHDREILKRRQQSGESASLDHEGIQEINQQFKLETEIIHEDEICDAWSIYHDDLSAELMRQVEAQFIRYQADFEENQEGIPRRCEEHLEVRALPALPKLFDREQVGLFAKRPIPPWTLFYWGGDLGVARSADRALLPKVTDMNRRTFVRFDGVDIFQGGSPTQRSGCGVLANYFWCHTQSTGAAQSTYRLLPFNFLGHPNCVYVTTKKGQHMCSALLSFSEIKRGEQILMFTGSEEQSKWVDRRLRLYRAAPILTSLALLCSLIKIYRLLNA